MLGKVLAVSSLIALVLLSAIMQVSSPSSVHPIVILLIFILIYVLAVGVLTFFIYTIGRAIARLTSQRKHTNLSLTESYYLASVVALMPVMVLGVQSIGRSDIYSTVLIVVFECIACFYVLRRVHTRT